MTVYDEPIVREALSGLYPERHEIEPDWREVLSRAGVHVARGRRFHRRRLLIALAAILVVLIAAAASISAGHGWWFLSEEGMGPTPSKEGVLIVATGEWDGHSWTLGAYRSKDATLNGGRAEICWALDNALGCAPIRESQPGLPPEISWGQSLGTGPTGLPPHVDGMVSKEVTHVRIELAGGQVINTETYPAPANLGLSVGFFAAPIPRCPEVERVVALDDQDNVVSQSEVGKQPPGFPKPKCD